MIEIGEREKDEGLLQEVVRALQGASAVWQANERENQKFTWSNLGNALQTLGEFTLDVDILKRVIDAQENTLDLKGGKRDVLDRVLTENNLGLAQRRLGAVSGDLEMLETARASYKACEDVDLQGHASFNWARLQWNIADLALARFQLEPDVALLIVARACLQGGRGFEDASDYQTQRCDKLLVQIEAAEAA